MWVLRTHISITANIVSELPLIKYQCKVFVMKQKDLKKGNGFFVNVFAGSSAINADNFNPYGIKKSTEVCK